MLVQSALEMASIALILPVIDIAITPGRLEKYGPIADVLRMAGFSDPRAATIVLAAGLIALFIGKNLLLFFVLWTQNSVNQSLQYDFRTRLLSGYLRQPYARALRQNSAHVVRNLFNSSPAIFANGVMGLFVVILEVLIVAAIGTVLVLVEPVGTLICAGLVGAIAAGYLVFSRTRIVAWGRRSDNLNGRMMRTVNEALGTVKEIKLRRCEPYFVNAFLRDSMEAAAIRVRLSMNGVAPRPVGEIVLVIAVMAVISAMMTIETRTFGEIVPVLTIFAAAGIRIMPSAARIVAGINNVREARGPLENVLRDYRAFPPAPAEAGATAETARDGSRFRNAISFENLTFRYEEAAQDALSELSLTIRKGESVAFVGPTGAGKSTLVDVMMGLLAPTRGAVKADGRDIRDDLPAWQRGIGYVPQVIVLIDDTIRRNIAFGVSDDRIDDARVWHAAKVAQIEDFIRSLPDGLDTAVGERGARISGGQRQRIGIARALYHDPEILVMDEATSSLDVLTEHQFAQAIEAVRGEKTLIVIAHRLSTVRKCDRIFMLEGGKIVASGTFDHVAATHPGLARMVEIDTEVAAG